MNLTQRQLADKYNVSQAVVSACLSSYNVHFVGKVYKEGHQRPFKLYPEEEAIEAFKAYYREKSERLRKKARAMDDIAESFRPIFEKAYLEEHTGVKL